MPKQPTEDNSASSAELQECLSRLTEMRTYVVHVISGSQPYSRQTMSDLRLAATSAARDVDATVATLVRTGYSDKTLANYGTYANRLRLLGLRQGGDAGSIWSAEREMLLSHIPDAALLDKYLVDAKARVTRAVPGRGRKYVKLKPPIPVNDTPVSSLARRIELVSESRVRKGRRRALIQALTWLDATVILVANCIPESTTERPLHTELSHSIAVGMTGTRA